MKMKSFSRMVPFMSSWMNTAGALRRLSHNGFRSDRLPDFAPPPEVPVNVAVTPSTAASIRKAEQFAIEHKEIARWLLAIFTLVTTLTVAIVQNRNAVEHAALKNEIDILKTQLGTEVCETYMMRACARMAADI